jgi:hypothetical protein
MATTERHHYWVPAYAGTTIYSEARGIPLRPKGAKNTTTTPA